MNFYTSERILKCAGYCCVRLETDDSEEPTIANVDDEDGWMDGWWVMICFVFWDSMTEN